MYDVKFDGVQLTSFTPVTESELETLIKASANKQCESDPLPTWLTKECRQELIPAMLDIINTSLETGSVPDSFKHALVRPLLKKSNLKKEELKNYRPVSNLPWLSKILERAVATRLEAHLQLNALHDPYQSAYRKFHSTETALLRVYTDIASALDRGSTAVLLMLDLSAAFDTIDHRILLNRLDYSFGIQGTAKKWFSSYLTERTQSVTVENEASKPIILDFSVPQGSVLGPKLYCGYCRPIGRIVTSFGLIYHIYADDTQLYFVLESAGNWTVTRVTIERCVNEIIFWMNANLLKINGEKTEYIVFSPSTRKNTKDMSLMVGQNKINPCAVVKNLGCYWDSHLTMEEQVNSVCKSCYYQIRVIRKIRPYLTKDACRTLVQALVTSRLDYANAMLAELPYTTLLVKLEKVQNSAARLISGTDVNEHITPILMELHWLPIPQRIKFKILLYVYKCLNSAAPDYLQELLDPYVVSDRLRPRGVNLLRVPDANRVYGKHTFSWAGSTYWNALPPRMREINSLTQFKRQLKTHLFNIAFN